MDWSAQIPNLFLVWVAAAVMALIDLAVSEFRGHLPPRPMLRFAGQCLGIGGVLTVYLIAADAYRHELIPLWSSIAAVVLAILVKLVLDAKLPAAGGDAGK
jgi:hypothetical protein